MISKEYLEWVSSEKEKESDLFPITNTQHRFIEWLLEYDQAKTLLQIGNLDEIFIKVREHLKNGGSHKEEENE